MLFLEKTVVKLITFSTRDKIILKLFIFTGDQKNTATQVSKDVTEMTQKVRFLELCRSHIEVCIDLPVYIYCLRHLFWFPFFGFCSMKSCTDPLNLNISQ